MFSTGEAQIIRELFGQLLQQKPCKFPDAGSKLDATNERGVYIIYSPENRVLHVGSTPRSAGGIVRRLRDHMAGQSSFTRKTRKKLGNDYGFRCLPVFDPRQRALLEALAIGELCPEHIGHGLE